TLRGCIDDNAPVPGVSSVLKVLRDSLSEAFDEFNRFGKPKPLTEWKNEYTKPDDESGRVIKGCEQSEKLRALADLYSRYRARMYEKRYYDYDDMILRVIETVGKNIVLARELRERYEFILVDEFQDTNGAQMKLLSLVAGESKNGRGPNVMAVGDDDQAIYKFQGAEISNILGFPETYPDAKVITITSNYRSTPDVLEVAGYVISAAENRLVSHITYLDKNIEAANRDILPGEITSRSFPSRLHEYRWTAREIKRLIDEGKSPDDIAVIARHHSDLIDIAGQLNAEGVPVRYERSNDVLKEEHVRQLIQMSRFVSTLGRKSKDEADELLPEILSYPFWRLPRMTVWGISRTAAGTESQDGQRKKPVLWLDVMLNYEDRYVKRIADFLIYVAEASKHATLERVLDLLMGADPAQAPENEDDDADGGTREKTKRFESPFKEYYFGREKFERNSVVYTKFLSSLRTFIDALRDYKKTELLAVGDLIDFITLHEENKIPVIDSSVFVNAATAVSLLTAHKAKGLEFDTVFVISCQEDVWAKSRAASKLTFPLNLPISPAGDEMDDRLRLFYVAVTRAKSNLYLTSYEFKDNGDESSRLGFITPPAGEGQEDRKLKAALKAAGVSAAGDIPEDEEVLESSWKAYHALPLAIDEKAVLEPLLETYKLSVTHMNNFLNVKEGGPQLFFEQTLLRFPQAKSAAGAYGSAVHRVMQDIYLHVKSNGGTAPPIDKILAWFKEELLSERLSEDDYRTYLKQGSDNLKIFLDKKLSGFLPAHLSEVNFRDQGVVIDGAVQLTGKIDKIVPSGDGEMTVHDFKTGKAKPDWKGTGPYEPIQLHQYKMQLLFYKILVENSRDYGGRFTVNRGVLEFVEQANGELIDLPLDIDREEYERTLRLASIVYNKIQSLDFPDVSGYSPDLKGILKFEDDLLEGKV
ncbi:MAG TPA: ATP-dependent DNA helicase, partial [Thermodesulfobacteriota bacterium]|nr:ATP-dependent DNA helicase [Thermodesulfobacteriota bacterium]